MICLRNKMHFMFNCLIICVAWNCIQAVRIKELRVPSSAAHDTLLDCKYDMENDQLYDVKWYKDGQQFFRCMPNGEVYEFPVEGVKLYHSGMAYLGSCSFTLTALTSKSAGEYRCEVSSEGPSFATVAQSRHLKIITPSRRIQNDIPNLRNNSASSGAVTIFTQAPIFGSLLQKQTAIPTVFLNNAFKLFIFVLFIFI